MDTATLRALGLRAVSAGWPWPSGSLYCHGQARIRILGPDEILCERRGRRPHLATPGGPAVRPSSGLSWPDLSDPATVGAGLGLIQTWTGAAWASVEPIGPDFWAVWPIPLGVHHARAGASVPEALVLALEELQAGRLPLP